MNLRQKYKRAKQRIEMLENRPANIVIRTEQYDIQKYVSERYFPAEVKEYVTEEEIKNMLVEDMNE